MTESGRQQVEDLLPLALSQPHEALARARAVLAARPDPYQASVAHQAAGIVLRDVGDTQAGVRELRPRCGWPGGPARRTVRPMPGPPSAWPWCTRAARRPGWPPSTGPPLCPTAR